jgi:hypothetical protein
MRQALFNYTIFLALPLGFSSCNGHAPKDLEKENLSESKTIPAGQAILVKTQGLNTFGARNHLLCTKKTKI